MGSGAELCSAGKKGEREGEGRKKENEKEKKKKGRGKKRKKREGGVGAIRGGGRPRACCGVRPVSDGREWLRREAMCMQNEGKGKGIGW